MIWGSHAPLYCTAYNLSGPQESKKSNKNATKRAAKAAEKAVEEKKPKIEPGEQLPVPEGRGEQKHC